ncbi:hypothetical protein KZZ52_58020 [Dactylosporangium sp. AC04546]|uniref:hypothetical protein n=1 Tax=Dactylosporangium sp. AC04546 TaxID=2862460 RepID=UPI001EE06FD9|nr:hypothetical protein [Dactylosporangium sp. AC04546]WVK83501.1 hypothetical protein KZZ52_58020 [Dactylosporangium sp. AC04546]
MRITLTAATAMAAAVLLIPAAPASAAAPDRWGFAYVKDPTTVAWTPLPPAYQYGSWMTFAPGLQADGIKIATGRFLVRFPQIGTGSRGIPHVTAVSADGRFCEAVRWYATGADQIVDVQCFKPGGAPIDSQFTVLWTVSSGTAVPGAYASVQANALGGIVQQYNSTGSANSVTASPPGYYQVRFKGVGAAGLLSGNLQVTAVQPNAQPRRCKVARWTFSGTDVIALVACFNPATGALMDSEFTASFHRERSVYAAAYPPRYFGYVASWAPPGQTNFNSIYGFGANGIGGPVVKYPDLHQKQTHAQVTAYGDTSGYCGLKDLWIDAGGTAVVTAACFTNAGAPVDLPYLSTFSSSV